MGGATSVYFSTERKIEGRGLRVNNGLRGGGMGGAGGVTKEDRGNVERDQEITQKLKVKSPEANRRKAQVLIERLGDIAYPSIQL